MRNESVRWSPASEVGGRGTPVFCAREQNHSVLCVRWVRLLEAGSACSEPGPREMVFRSQPGFSRLARDSKQP